MTLTIGHSDSTRSRDRSEWLLACQIPAIISQEQFEMAQVNLRHQQRTAK
ncbi:MAG: hypothetical protein HC936_05545 [Leptolyngbyaceae cyanobacterium SU_3_3]|nr:hypothetical protein [Leptolyngbyaceae cyanobacterium SU_3_3]